MQTDKYCIIEGYKINTAERPCDVTNQIVRGEGDRFQSDVYMAAEAWAKTYKDKIKSVLDIGTGSGFKLMKYFSEFDTIGIEKEPNFDFLIKTYPNQKWIYADYTKPPNHYDMIICADVLEHVLDPDIIMKYIKAADPFLVVLSTPARELLAATWKEHVIEGPPANPGHVREWTTEEFINYVYKWFGDSEFKLHQTVFDRVGNMVTLIKQ